ncbi:methionyl-tRNA formyltransferase [Natronobiforma cellulositropha]|uniref:methionyl-tRNA formyltransferase n=1 Tax=Natronobiforma cellulositropha TaxID=1679076 RepID=UPI0021D56FDE|nr:methionyl-tRNA formyltransferase [Natronobiforma cellulositropha]
MTAPSDSAICYVGCTAPAHDVLETLLERGLPITEIVTIDREMARANHVSGYASFADLAEAYDVPLYYPATYSMNERTDIEHFESLEADLLVVNGWQRLIPAAILETATYGGLGNHGSAYGLPKGRGRSPLNWSLIEDRDRFLLSVITLDPDADAGDVVATRKFDITEFDTIRTLYYKVTMALQEMLLEVIDPILSGERPLETQSGEATYYPKRNPEDGEINWEDGTQDVYNLVRAVADPYPGAFTFVEGESPAAREKVMIWEARPFSADLGATADAGTILEVFWSGDFVVATADGTVLVTEYETDGWEPRVGETFVSRGSNRRVDSVDHRHNLTSGASAGE